MNEASILKLDVHVSHVVAALLHSLERNILQRGRGSCCSFSTHACFKILQQELYS